MNPIDRSLLDIFSAEQAEHVARIRSLLDDLSGADPDARAAAVDELLRRLHSLKGAARAVGLERTELLTHQAEEVLSRVRLGGLEFSEPVRRALDRTTDAIEDILAAAVADRPLPPAAEALQELLQFAGQFAPVPDAPVAQPPRSEPASPAIPPLEHVRVNAGGVDNLIRNSAELVIDSAAQNSEARATSHAGHLESIAREWQRLRRASASAVRELGRDPQFHAIAECLSFIDSRLFVLSREAHAMAEALGNSTRTSRERAARLYQSACEIRMTPAESLLGAFGPMIRDLAQQESKETSFHADGLDINADRLVLQGLKDPVMHLLRNAVSHGIETAGERVRAGKPPEGTIRLRLGSRGDRLSLTIEDDGRGLNYDAVAEEARRNGLLPADGSAADPDELARLVFHPGLSTSRAVTGVSGRGMGLSVVERAVNSLRGEVSIQPRPGGGTRVRLLVPISISTQHVLLVAAAGHTFGISTSFVEGLHRVKLSDIRNVNGRESIVSESGPVPLLRLASLLDLHPAAAHASEGADLGNDVSCAILTLNERRAAIAVDALVDQREAIIKDTGLPDSATTLTAGAVPLEDGTVAVMLNVKGLFQRIGRGLPSPAIAPPPQKKRPTKVRVLVVDDSLTTRSLEKSILEAHGYEVQLAVDGLDALERLRIEIPDLVISDVMMPRLTGFQLLEKMKSDEVLKKIPVILVTSLESREEQHMGLSLGADAYIVKRKFDQRELLNVIREIV